MKKIVWISLSLVAALAVSFVVYQNLPQKRFARHLIKARLYVKENNFEAAKKEYESAFNAKDGYTPYVSLEVLKFENDFNVREGKADMAINNTKKYVEMNPDSKKGRMILANLAFQTGNIDVAFDAIQSILARDPSNMDARLLLALVRTKQGRLDLAEEQMRVLLKEFPDSLMALLPLSTNLIQQGRTKESRSYLQKVLQKDPSHQFARLQLLDTYVLEGRMDSAYALLDGWVKIDSNLNQAIDIRRARLNAFQKNFTLAKTYLQKYRSVSKEHLPALSELAILHARLAEYDSALTIYSEVASRVPESKGRALFFEHLLQLAINNPAKSLALLGELTAMTPQAMYASNFIATYYALDQTHKADKFIEAQSDTLQPYLKAFAQYLQPNPQFVGYWALIQYYNQNQQRQEVYRIASEWYQRWPTNTMVANHFADQLLGLGQNQQALTVLNGIASPTIAQQVTQVTILSQMGNKAAARQVAEKLYREHGKSQGIPSLLANMYLEEKNNSKATALFEEELSRNPNNLLALNNVAWEYGINQKSLAKAAPYLKTLQKLDPSDPRIIDTMAWILAQNGKLEEAKTYANLALHLIPDHPSFLYHLGWIKWKMGNKAEALELLAKADASKRSFDEKAEVQALIADLSNR